MAVWGSKIMAMGGECFMVMLLFSFGIALGVTGVQCDVSRDVSLRNNTDVITTMA